MQGILLRLVKSTKDREIIVHVLQFATLLLHNIKSYATKSSAYVESLIKMPLYEDLVVHPFEFLDEEVGESYIALLKGITLNLPDDLLLAFLLNRNFSLFTSTRMFCFYKEAMMRTASRTVLLKLIGLNHPLVKEYVISSGFLLSLVVKVRENLYKIENILKEHGNYVTLRTTVSFTVDLLYLIQDVFSEDITEISEQLYEDLMNHLVLLLLDGISYEKRENTVTISVSLFFLVHLVQLVNHKRLLEEIVTAIGIDKELIGVDSPKNEVNLDGKHTDVHSTEWESSTLDNSCVQRNSVRSMILSILNSKDETLITLGLSLLNSITSSKSIQKPTGKLCNNDNLDEYDNELVTSILSVLYLDIPLKLITYQLVFNILYNLGDSENIEKSITIVYQKQLTAIHKVKSKEAEDLLNANGPDFDFFKIIQEEWSAISKTTFTEKYSCSYNLLLPNIYDTPPSTPYSQCVPQTMLEISRNLLHVYILLIYFQSHTTHNAPCIIFTRNTPVSINFINLHTSLFNVLFSKITHKPDLTDISEEPTLTPVVPSEDYSKLIVLFTHQNLT